MSQYILVLIWIGAFSFGIKMSNAYYKESLYGREMYRINPWIGFLMIVPLIYWAGVRPSGIFDTGAYARTFTELPDTFDALVKYIPEITKDKGYYILASCIRIVFGADTKIYFLIIAFLQGVMLFRLLQKYSSNFILSVFIFVASADYLSWMHNGVRQFLAVTIILLGTDFIVEQKYVKAIVVILIASLFHGSALLMIPIIFIVQGKPWNIKTIALLVLVMIAILYIDQFTVWLDTALADTQYTNVVSDWESWNDNGTSPIRVLVYSIPTILSLLGRRYINAANDRVINICVNMSIASTAIYIVSMFTSGIFIGRLPIYASIYATCILLPWEIDNYFTKNSAFIVKSVLIVSYLAYYYYQVHIIWGAF